MNTALPKTQQQLIDEIIKLSGQMPNVERYKNHLWSLSLDQLKFKLEDLEKDNEKVHRGYSRLSPRNGRY
jgi:hypothetical protein